MNSVPKNNFFLGVCLLSLSFSGCTSSSPPRFDGEAAFTKVLEQCQFGPRNPGSAGHERAKNYLLDKLREHSSFVKIQDFTFSDPEQGVELELTNIIASFYPKRTKRVLLCAHWDTRPFADRDPDTSLRAQPIPGANDGASGVAVLLEIARIVSLREPLWGVDIVLFDGEDGGEEGDVSQFSLGSKYFAKHRGDYQPEFGMVLDMIGDRELTVYKEGYSSMYARELVDSVWSRAEGLGLFCFRDSVKHFVYDDHVPLLSAGIPVIDIIDFDYPYWHTLSDTPDKCSPESLQKIGDLVLEILYRGIQFPRSGL
ncbi:MAG: M28 family peptidase [candidate division Zixibacteria bacterium]|nr:M28 family peptidase [candidate division Zixibacteria bacterium]